MAKRIEAEKLLIVSLMLAPADIMALDAMAAREMQLRGAASNSSDGGAGAFKRPVSRSATARRLLRAALEQESRRQEKTKPAAAPPRKNPTQPARIPKAAQPDLR